MAFSETAKKEIFERAGGKCEHCGKTLAFANHEEGERESREWRGVDALREAERAGGRLCRRDGVGVTFAAW